MSKRARAKYAEAFTAEIRVAIEAKVNLSALGNSNRSLRDLAVDLINASDLDWRTIATGCFLHPKTVQNLAQDKTRWPRADTVERVMKYFHLDGEFDVVPMEPKFLNQKKEKK